MRTVIATSALLLLIACSTTAFHFETEGLPADQLARITVPNNIVVYRIDGTVTGYRTFSGSYHVYVAPGEHEFTLQFSENRSAGGTVAYATSDDAVVRHELKAGRAYVIGSRSIGNFQREFTINAYAVEVPSVPVAPKTDWKPGEVLALDRPDPPADEAIVVHFRQFPDNDKAWVTIVPAGADPKTWGDWQYTKGERDGALTFPGQSPGRYEVRGYHDGGFVVQAQVIFEVR